MIGNLIGAVIRTPSCFLRGGMIGHQYERHGDYVVCKICGDKVKVKA